MTTELTPTQVAPSDDAASLATVDDAERFDAIHETMDAAATDYNDPLEAIPFIADSTDEWPQNLKSDPVVAGFIEAIRNAAVHAKRLKAHIGNASWQGKESEEEPKEKTWGRVCQATAKRARPE